MKKLYSVLLVFLGLATFTNAQTASEYFFKYKTNIALESMTGAKLLLGAMADGHQSETAVFFPFTFSGQSYDRFSVSEDGVVILGNAVYSPYAYDNYFAQSNGYPAQTINPVYPILLPWGEDLGTAIDGSIQYKIVGTSPYRKLVIEFKVNSVEDNVANYNKTFQVWLFEGSNQIQYVYGTCAADWWNRGNIGIASSAANFLSVNGADNTVSPTTVYSNEAPGFDKATIPAAETAFIFSPTEIAEAAPVPPAAPVKALLSLLPAYPVAGQQMHTIYLGYGTQAVTLQADVSGGNPPAAGYAFAWSSSDGSFSATTASPSVSPNVTTTYTVAVSDGKGNATTQSITVYVIDPRFGDKFKVCKGGKTSIYISKEAVEAQLQNGGTLGECTAVASVKQRAATAFSLEAGMTETTSSGVTVYPNPSAGVIHVMLPATAQQRTVMVFDASGMVVAQKTVSEKEQTIQFDLTAKARGLYMIKTSSNGRVQVSKLIIR